MSRILSEWVNLEVPESVKDHLPSMLVIITKATMSHQYRQIVIPLIISTTVMAIDWFIIVVISLY